MAEIIHDEASQENVTELTLFISDLKQFIFKSSEVKCNIIHCKLFIQIAKQIFGIFATGGGLNNIEISFSIFTTTFDMLLKL
jgi:hypothetical protein